MLRRNKKQIEPEEEKYVERIKVKRSSRNESDLYSVDQFDKYKGTLYQKKKINLKMGNDNLYKNLNLTKYGNDEDEEYDYDFRNKSIAFKDQESLLTKLSETFKKSSGNPTKIKIYKCVIWKNPDPTLDEDTIKKMLHKSGSQIFNKGGFIVKLPQNNKYK